MLHRSWWFRRVILHPGWLVGLLCLSIALWDVGRAQEPGLEFLEQEEVQQEIGKADSLTVAVRNGSAAAHDLQFRIEMHNEDVIETINDIQVSPAPARLAAHEIKLFTLTIPAREQPASGYLVVAATSGTTNAGYRPLSFIEPAQALLLPSAFVSPDLLVIVGLFVACMMFLIMWRTSSAGLGDYLLLEPPNWSTSSWVTNITAVVALVNLVFSPQDAEEPLRYFSAAQYKGLGLLFAALVLAAPLMYSLTCKEYTLEPPVDGKTTALRSYVGWFLLSSAVLFCGAFGQWLLTLLAVDELRVAGVLSSLTSAIFFILLVAVAMLFLSFTIPALYNLVKMYRRERDKKEPERRLAPFTEVPPMNMARGEPTERPGRWVLP